MKDQISLYLSYVKLHPITSALLVLLFFTGVILAIFEPEVSSNKAIWNYLLYTSWIIPVCTFGYLANLEKN